MDHSSEKDYNLLVVICQYLIEQDIQAMTAKNYHMIIEKYNQEQEPEMTILWKAVQLDLIPILELLLKPVRIAGRPLCDINRQTQKYNRTVMMQLVKTDILKRKCAGLFSENIRLNLVNFLMQYGPNLGLHDYKGHTAF